MVFVQTWRYGGVSITDMTHAHKRGKVCRQIRWGGESLDVLTWARSLDASTPFDDAASALRELVRAHEATTTHRDQIHESEIRGVDAPRVPLVAGVPGVWSASADHTGVCVRDLVDTINEPTYINGHQQKDTTAYQCAAKVWADLSTANTANQAAEVLRRGGCRLHYFCAVD